MGIAWLRDHGNAQQIIRARDEQLLGLAGKLADATHEGVRISKEWREYLVTPSGSSQRVVEVAALDARLTEQKTLETQRGILAYLNSNGISVPTPLRPGMKLDALIGILGEPTGRYQGKRKRIGEKVPEGELEDWVEWYHNAENRHVAPFICAQVVNGVVAQLAAHRR